MAFACDMTALTAEQRAAHARTTRALFGAMEGVEELPDGFAFRIPASGDLLRSAAAFVILERLCCPFFGFSIDLAPGADSFRLGIVGPAGVKPFIREELAEAFPAAGAEGGAAAGTRRN